MKWVTLMLPIILYIMISCSKESVPPDCKGEPQLIFCTKEYNPVCGCDGVTYGNACEAQAAGIQNWENGECQ